MHPDLIVFFPSDHFCYLRFFKITLKTNKIATNNVLIRDIFFEKNAQYLKGIVHPKTKIKIIYLCHSKPLRVWLIIQTHIMIFSFSFPSVLLLQVLLTKTKTI